MKLHANTHGHGPTRVLVHGWGLHSGVWQPVVERLAAQHRVVTVDLPGHGRSGFNGPFDLDELADALVETVTEPALWVGWSLGGLAVQRLARRHPQRVSRMALVATTPCFTHRDTWPWAMRPESLAAFAHELEGDFEETLRRFIGLQARGDSEGRAVLRDLRQRLAAWPPLPEALVSGLAILRDCDLRADLPHLQPPALWVGGSRDRLIPPQALEQAAALMAQAQVQLFNRAGHAPFLSDPDGFAACIERFEHG